MSTDAVQRTGGRFGFSIPSFAAHLHVCSWTLFTLQEKCANTSSSSSPSFLFVSLLYSSLPALLFQMNAASSALCVFLLFLLVWQPPAPLNTCLCNSSFSLQNSPSTDVLFLSVAHHTAPLSTYLSLCCILLCVFSLICAVKNPVLLFLLIIVERGESFGQVWRQVWGSSLPDLISWPLAGGRDISWVDSFGTDLVNSSSCSTPSVSLV